MVDQIRTGVPRQRAEALGTPFGGIIVSNRPFDLALAEKVDEIFTEVLIAPSFTDEALARLKKKKTPNRNRRRP